MTNTNDYTKMRQEALKELEIRLYDKRITKKSQVDYFLFVNFGLGITTSNRILTMLEDIGRLKLQEDGSIIINGG